MPKMEVFVHPLDGLGHHQMAFNVDSGAGQLAQGQLRMLEVKWDTPPYSALLQLPSRTLAPNPVVGEVGSALYGQLFSHPNAELAYHMAASANDLAERGIRITIYSNADDAHRIPWELLRSEDGFISLEKRVPIVRIAPDGKKRPDGVIIDRQLRIILVLGAVGIDCEPEWRAFRKALESWNHSLHVQVLTYDRAIKDEIDRAPESQGVTRPGANGTPPVTRRIEARFIPASPEALMQFISNQMPHICHFFCHGTANEQGQLEIGHLGTEAGDDPLYLGRHHLGQLGNSAWLMVLNACETAMADDAAASASMPAPVADPVSQDGSFVTALVAEGIPYVLGMRQKIASNIVPKFTFAFYDAVLDQLTGCVAKKGRCLLDLDPALIRGQDAICAHFGNPVQVCQQQQDWSLPVIYTRPQLFHIVSVQSGAGGYEEAVRDVAQRATLIDIREKAADQGGVNDLFLDRIDDEIAKLDVKLGIA